MRKLERKEMLHNQQPREVPKPLRDLIGQKLVCRQWCDWLNIVNNYKYSQLNYKNKRKKILMAATKRRKYSVSDANAVEKDE